MKKLFLALLASLLLSACAPEYDHTAEIGRDLRENTDNFVENDVYNYLDEVRYIDSYDHVYDVATGIPGYSIVLYTDKAFKDLDVSKQLSFAISVFDNYNKLFEESSESLYSAPDLVIYSDSENDFPTYHVDERGIELIAQNLTIKRGDGEEPHELAYKLVDLLDKGLVLDGTKAGLDLEEYENDEDDLFSYNVIDQHGQIDDFLDNPEELLSRLPEGERELIAEEMYVKEDDTTDVASSGTLGDGDTETYIDGMNGADWNGLTENQKFHAVSNAMYNLDQNGYTILESEDYYISALNEFYTSTDTISTPVSQALASVGVMSGTMIE